MMHVLDSLLMAVHFFFTDLMLKILWEEIYTLVTYKIQLITSIGVRQSH